MRRGRWLRWAILVVLLAAAVPLVRSHLINRPLYLRNLRLLVPLPTLSDERLGDRLLIVAPHPDDETLGCAGLIQRALARRAQVHVALMTNGDGSELALLPAERAVRGTPAQFMKLGRLRQKESLAALASLGLPAENLFFLGYPNGDVDRMWLPEHWSVEQPLEAGHTRVRRNPYENSLTPGGSYSGAQALEDLIALFEQLQPSAVVVPPPFDIHPDHWGTFNFTQLAIAEYEHRHSRRIGLYCYLIHYPDWPAPRGYHPQMRLLPPVHWVHYPDVDWYALPLTPEQTRVKREALRSYKSQLANYDRLLLSFVRSQELFCSVPEQRLLRDEIKVLDPLQELPLGPMRFAGAIGSLEIKRVDGGFRISLHLQGQVDPRVRYLITWHSVGDPQQRAGRFTVRGSQAHALQSTASGQATALQLEHTVSGSVVSVLVPDALWQGPAVVIDAFARKGRAQQDHVLTRVLRLQ